MGPGFWKLNCSHLKDIEFCRMFKESITNTVDGNKNLNHSDLWDMIKLVLSSISDWKTTLWYVEQSGTFTRKYSVVQKKTHPVSLKLRIF